MYHIVIHLAASPQCATGLSILLQYLVVVITYSNQVEDSLHSSQLSIISCIGEDLSALQEFLSFIALLIL